MSTVSPNRNQLLLLALGFIIFLVTGLIFLGVASSQFLMAENLTKISFYRTAFGAVVNIILNLFLIPLYGALGSAIATLIAYFSATFFLVFFKSTRTQIVPILKSFSPISALRVFK